MRSVVLPLLVLLTSGCLGIIIEPGGSEDPGGDPAGPGDDPDDDPPTRPVDPSDPDPDPDPGPETDDPPDDGPLVRVPPGGACDCDSDCDGSSRHPGLCIHGICGAIASSSSCAPGSAAECPDGMRCWSGTGTGICYPDFDAASCEGEPDSYGSCVRGPDQGCYEACGRQCDLPGLPPDGGEEADGDADVDGDVDADVDGDVDADGDVDGDLGPCSGTADECEAARIINEYRTAHVNAGECNHPLRWNDRLGSLAHEHQSGPFVRHSSHGYVENVGMAYGLRETTEYIIQYEPGIEPHCNADGSYRMSHHCAAMFCNNYTVGIGVYRAGDTVYMTMMFGDRDGNPSW